MSLLQSAHVIGPVAAHESTVAGCFEIEYDLLLLFGPHPGEDGDFGQNLTEKVGIGGG